MDGSGGHAAQKRRTPQKMVTRPDLDQVSAYCLERKNKVDPQKWLDHYKSNGWRVGKNAMKDWRAAVRTWEKNEYGDEKSGTKEQGALPGICKNCRVVHPWVKECPMPREMIRTGKYEYEPW